MQVPVRFLLQEVGYEIGSRSPARRYRSCLILRPYYTVQLIALATATELQQLLSALLHTGNQYSVGCCRGRVLYWECET